MAAPSSPIHCNSSVSIKLSLNSSRFFPFRYTNRRRFFLLSSPKFSALGCRCSSNSTSTEDKTTSHAATIKLPKTAERIAFENDDFSNNEESEFSVKSANLAKKSQRLSFEGKALRSRILFASKKVRSILLLNVITIIYASNIPVVKEVEGFVDPGAFTIVRFVLAAIPFIPFVLKARDDVQTRNAGIELGFWVSLGYLLQALGLQTSGAGRASFLTMFTVIVVPLLDGLLGSRIPARTWFGALMSVVGVGMLESSGSPPCVSIFYLFWFISVAKFSSYVLLKKSIWALRVVGDLLNFLSAASFGVHMLRTEHISRSTSKDNFLPLLGYEVCVVAFLSTLWYIFGVCSGGTQELNPSSWTWAKLLDWMVAFPWAPAIYTGIVSTGLCLWVELAAMRDVSATETAIIYGLEPLWGAAFAWFLLGERWGISGWIGAALVLCGSLTVQIHGASSSTPLQRGEGSAKKGNDTLISDKENVLSTSAVLVNSSKDSGSLLKK